MGDLIIYKNVGFKSDDKRGELSLSNDIFDTERDKTVLRTDLLQFSKNLLAEKN